VNEKCTHVPSDRQPGRASAFRSQPQDVQRGIAVASCLAARADAQSRRNLARPGTCEIRRAVRANAGPAQPLCRGGQSARSLPRPQGGTHRGVSRTALGVRRDLSMNAGAGVHSLDALTDWYAALTQFCDETQNGLTSMALALQRAFDWLAEQQQEWRRE